MKITRTFLKNLLKEAVKKEKPKESKDDACPVATVDERINSINKGKSAVNRDIAYMHPEDAEKILKKAEKEELCKNCGAFDVSKEMKNCGVEVLKGYGYCKMHDFSCHEDKTCLTWAPGGPKK
jgi:hypothetical protein